MSGAVAAIFGGSPASIHLDTQTVTVGGVGTAPAQDRLRGYILSTIGSISDGTSNVYAGNPAVTTLCWDENGGAFQYVLSITGAADSGWTQISIGGTKTLTRASASTFSAGTWTWTTTDTLPLQAFGAIGSIKPVYFD